MSGGEALRRGWAVLERLGRGWAHRPLGVALLAAVLVHGLGLTYASLRQSRRAPVAARPATPDDTAELLRFSRRAPQALPLSMIPLPPPSVLPPPPPELLTPLPGGKVAGGQGSGGRGVGGRGPAGSGAKPTGNRGGLTPRLAVAATVSRAAAARPELVRGPASGDAANPAGLAKAREALEALRIAPAEEGNDSAGLEALWEQANRVRAEGLTEGMELRRLAAARARELGLGAGEQRSGSWQNRLLVVWLEGDQVWLLQAPVVRGESGGAG